MNYGQLSCNVLSLKCAAACDQLTAELEVGFYFASTADRLYRPLQFHLTCKLIWIVDHAGLNHDMFIVEGCIL